jgi:hypothetical protein
MLNSLTTDQRKGVRLSRRSLFAALFAAPAVPAVAATMEDGRLEFLRRAIESSREWLRTLPSFESDPWDKAVLDFARGKYQVTVPYVLAGLGIPAHEQAPGDARRVAAILVYGGWRKQRVRAGDGRQRVMYRAPEVCV